jgi:hypothetical protein
VICGIFHYLHCYPSYIIYFIHKEYDVLQGYSDVSYVANIDDHTSIKTYIFMLGSTAISYSCKKQSSKSHLDYKSKYRALANYTCEVFWLHRLLEEIKCIIPKPTLLGVDNQSTIKLAQNYIFHDKPSILRSIGMLHNKKRKWWSRYWVHPHQRTT